MPFTVDGIGTHYYGKSKKTSRTGVCRACGASGRLDSYDTRLWFVIFYIPIIPLGRKRITDQCPRCRRHWAAAKSEFEAVKRESITTAMAKYQESPSPEGALEVHGSLLAFHEYDKAEQFRKLAMEHYPESDLLLRGLAGQMESVGRPAEAQAFFEAAFALQPELPEVRIGMAGVRISEGKLDEARGLLKVLETPGAGQLYPLGRLEDLAHAYQRAGRHAETLEICKHLLAERPAVGQVRSFRKFVADSEKALGVTESLLPQQAFSVGGLFSGKSGRFAGWQRGLAVAAAALVIAAIVLAATNEYWRQHRGVYVANDSGRPLRVTIDDGPPVEVDSLERLEVAEGRHHVKLSGAVADALDIELSTGYFSRWTDSPVWVINADGGTALVLSTIHYAVHPRPAEDRLLAGQRFFYVPHVDYAFEPPPQSIKVEGRNSEQTKIHLDRANAPAVDVFWFAVRQGDAAAGFGFGEARLRRNRQDAALLAAYEEAAVEAGQVDRARKFLHTGLAERPLLILWHRAYQDLGKTAGQDAALAAEYDALLKKEPQSAGLLYLRGRVEDDHAKGEDFFRQASAADPTLPWPWMALAYDAATRGDWPESRKLADKAFDLKLDHPSLGQVRRAARLATGDTAAMERECRQAVEAGPPGDVKPLIDLCEVLVVEDKTLEARQALTKWEERLPADMRTTPVAAICRQVVGYMLGDFAAVEQAAAGPALPQYRIQALVAAGRPQDAAKDPALQEALKEPWTALALSVSYSLAGDAKQSAAWREKACAALARQDTDSKRAAALLRGATALSRKQLDNVELSPNFKALLLAALAIRFPEQKAELAAGARRMNVGRLPPYHLVRKAAEFVQGKN